MKAELKAGNEDPHELEPSRRQENEQQRISTGTSVIDRAVNAICVKQSVVREKFRTDPNLENTPRRLEYEAGRMEEGLDWNGKNRGGTGEK